MLDMGSAEEESIRPDCGISNWEYGGAIYSNGEA